MKIHPISTTINPCFKGDNNQSNVGKAVGFIAGGGLGGGLIYSQMKSLKTIDGKRNLIEGFHAKDMTLNDVMKHEVIRNSENKIIPPTNGVSKRTKQIVKDFKKSLFIWAATITVLGTGLGALVDRSITTVNKKEHAS